MPKSVGTDGDLENSNVGCDFYDQTQKFYNDGERKLSVVSMLEKAGVEGMAMSEIKVDDQKELLIKGLAGTELLKHLEVVFDSSKPKLGVIRKLSPGLAYRPMPWVLLLELLVSTPKIDSNVNYTDFRGPVEANEAMRLLEGHLLGDVEAYSKEGVFMVSGGSNGISNVMSFVDRGMDRRSVVACGPSYVQFLRNAKTKSIPLDVLVHEEANNSSGKVRFLPTVAQIERAVSDNDAGSLVITQPGGATGEFYPRAELEEIVELAVARDLLIIEDAVFEELVFSEYCDGSKEDGFCSVSEVAHNMGVLDKVVRIKSFSKGKNFPGSRIGSIMTTNQDLIDFLSVHLKAERDFEGGVYNDIICLDSVLRLIEHRFRQFAGQNVNREKIIAEILKEYVDAGLLSAVEVPVNIYTVQSYIEQRVGDMEVYRVGLEAFKRSPVISAISDNRAAFNALFRLPDCGKEMMTIAKELFIFEGVETEWGPNFGLSKESGLWMRGTFSSSEAYIENSLTRLERYFRELCQ